MFLVCAVLPGSTHRHGVFADGNADAEGGTKFHTNRLNGVEEIGVFAFFSGSNHPVGRELDIADVAHLCGGEVGQAFTDGNASGGRCIENGQWRAFTDRHGLAGGAIHRRGSHGDIGYGSLPWADHLVAGDHPGYAAVGDGDEEGLVGNGREAEYAVDRIG